MKDWLVHAFFASFYESCSDLPTQAFAIMPSLFRFLVIVAVLGGLGYAAVYVLANFVELKPREITVTIPPDRFLKR